ncbi:MAG: carboxypeptidase-like regulatory domain-containing protein, partial [Gemmatimonadaceae bacterium]
PGGHTLLLRRIGYHSVERRVTLLPGANLQFAVAMSAVPQQLDRVVVEAPGISRRRGTSSIGGTVSDSAGHSVVGADVRLLGSGLSTITDSSGTFLFQGLAPGPYIVRARREGLAAGNAAMQIADDDNRGITMKMYGLPLKTRAKDVPLASGFGIADLGYAAFDRRVRSRLTSALFGPADMFRADRASLDFMFRQYRETGGTRRRSATTNEGVGSTEDGDCLLIDGRRAMYRPLSTYSSVSVLLAEVFRANASVDDFTVSEMQSLRECRGTMDHHPTYYVLWTRAMR